ncbi:MAG: type II toxin-antitoxin system VapC family toxin [Myxococcales bacterium]|nr:type II toxin-antitoxin system VapC family toxin [Myxococcales bacterium]MDP3503611.1 type II toxin-antitoxin system VapC family toxin [Myxococcales bacterium]
MRLAIDTNAYRLMMDADAEAVRLVRSAERLFLPVPVLAELRFGFLNGTRGRENEATLIRFLDRPRVEVLRCDEETTVRYAELKMQLKKQGTPIPINDVWIAALALQHQATLFTRDSDFERIPQLARV